MYITYDYVYDDGQQDKELVDWTDKQDNMPGINRNDY